MAYENKDRVVSAIAKKYFRVTELKTRHSDSLDFYDIAVWQIEDGLTAAYEAGYQCARQRRKKPAVPAP